METLAIIINYESATHTLQAVQSVLDSESLGPVVVRVVDNSENPAEADRLRANLSPSVDLVVNAENEGFGRACNRAAESWKGEAILLINPDARVLPGCLKRLQKTLFSVRSAAAVSPQIFWDEQLEFYFPPPCSPALTELQVFLEGEKKGYATRVMDAYWRNYVIRRWRAKMPVRVRNLSGGMVLLKCDCLPDADKLFDPRFYLYYEDMDLFLRLKKAGFDLLIEPRARAIHYYNQCAVADVEQKRRLMHASMTLFWEKHSRILNKWPGRALSHLLPSLKIKGQTVDHEFSHPFSIQMPAFLRREWLFEWSPNPDFIPSAGRFGSGRQFEFPHRCWEKLARGRYYGRFGKPKAFERRFLKISWVVA